MCQVREAVRGVAAEMGVVVRNAYPAEAAFLCWFIDEQAGGYESRERFPLSPSDLACELADPSRIAFVVGSPLAYQGFFEFCWVNRNSGRALQIERFVVDSRVASRNTISSFFREVIRAVCRAGVRMELLDESRELGCGECLDEMESLGVNRGGSVQGRIEGKELGAQHKSNSRSFQQAPNESFQRARMVAPAVAEDLRALPQCVAA